MHVSNTYICQCFKGDPTLVIQSKHWNWSKKIHLSYSIKAWSGRWLRLPVKTLKICPQHVGIKPKPLLRKFNLPVETLKICPQLVGIKPSPFWENLIPVETLKICTHKNLPCVLKKHLPSVSSTFQVMFDVWCSRQEKGQNSRRDDSTWQAQIFWLNILLGFVVNPVKFLLQYHSLFPLCFS
jgi:hypothetical protein